MDFRKIFYSSYFVTALANPQGVKMDARYRFSVCHCTTSSLLIKISIQSDLLYQIPRNVDPLKNSSTVTSSLLFTTGCQFLEKWCIIEEEIHQAVRSCFISTYRPDTAQKFLCKKSLKQFSEITTPWKRCYQDLVILAKTSMKS